MTRKVEETIECSTKPPDEKACDLAHSDDDGMEDFSDARASPPSTSSLTERSTPKSSTAALADDILSPATLESKLIFAFGPFKRHFFYSNIAGSWRTSISSKPDGHSHNSTFKSIGHTYAFAFSPHGDELAVYKDVESDSVVWSFSPSSDSTAPSYQTLRGWLNKNVPRHDEAQMREVKVMFGPGASYYAYAGGKCIHHDLPEALVKALEKNKSKGLGYPDIVALGGKASRGPTYLACWKNGPSIWSLDSTTSLYELVAEEDGCEKLQDVYMSPVRSMDFVAVKKDGHVTWSIPGEMGGTTFPRYFLAHMQGNAKERGKSYDLNLTGDMDKSMSITPETNHTFEMAGEGIAKTSSGLARAVVDSSSGWLTWIKKSV